MRIISGAWKGRALVSPPGFTTRPTAQRVRQALFDIMHHAPWGGRALLEDASVLDGFAGTGALGLEAMSRGAAEAVFFETDAAALQALRANVTACRAGSRARIVAADLLKPGPGTIKSLIFLDPPYGKGLVDASIMVLRQLGWAAPGSIIVCETSPLDKVVETRFILASRVHGAAQLIVWRE